MDSLFNDIRFWLVAIGTVLSALIAKIVKSYDDRFSKQDEENKELKEENKELRDDIEDLRKDVSNTHTIISGHLKYHQGLQNGKS